MKKIFISFLIFLFGLGFYGPAMKAMEVMEGSAASVSSSKVPSAAVIETYMKGTRALAEGKFALAIKYLGQCRELAPEDCSIQLQLGKAYLAIGSFGRAMDEGKKAKTCQNLNGEAERFLGRVYMMFSLRGDRNALDNAVKVLTEGTSMYPENFGLWAELGEVRIAMGEHREALHAYLRLRKLVVTPSYPLLDRIQELHRLLGQDLARVETLWDMLRFFGDQNGEARELESIFFHSGDNEARELLYATMLSWDPGHTRSRTSLAELLAEQGSIQEALQVLNEEPAQPPHPALLRLKAKLLIRAHDQRQAEHILRSLLVNDPNRASLHLELGHLWLLNGHLEKAQQHLQKALDRGLNRDQHQDLVTGLLDYGGPKALFSAIPKDLRSQEMNYLAFLAGVGDLPETIPADAPKILVGQADQPIHLAWLESLESLSNERSKLHWLTLLCHSLPTHDALALVQAWLAKAEYPTPGLALLALVSERVGDLDLAWATHLKLLNKNPENPWILNNAGFFRATTMKQPEDSLPILEKALTQDPNSPWILDSLGWAHWKRGNPKMALPLLNKAWQRSLDSKAIRKHIKVLTGKYPKSP